MDKRTIVVVTGSRAEYGLLSSTMHEIRARDDLELSVVVTGMHLSPQHGQTIEEIHADGFDIDRRVPMLLEGDSEHSMAKSVGVGVSGMSDTLDSLDPDIVLVLGDRTEALAAGLAAAHMMIPVAHIHGGDVMQGSLIDDSIRHALTKFAHLHFPASEQSAERIKKLGEEEWRITIGGAPGLDAVLASDYADSTEICHQYGIDTDKPLVLLVQHPVTTQPDQAGKQMQATLDALGPLDAKIVLIYPNSDAGGKRMIEVIEATEFEHLQRFKSLPRREYLALMDAADVMIGNSSSGIIEAPSFDLPVVDIGPRQEGRQHAENVVSVPHETDPISEAVQRCLDDESVRQRAAECNNPYDYGGAGERIASRLADVTLDYDLLRKRMTY